MVNKYKWPLILVLGLPAGAFFFHDHFYQRGIRALVHFSASYDRFDEAMSDFSVGQTDDLESQAGAALAELKTRATFRLSSFIKNDGELMNQAREVAALAQKELESLRARGYGLAEEYGVLREKSMAVYARFQALGEKKGGNQN